MSLADGDYRPIALDPDESSTTPPGLNPVCIADAIIYALRTLTYLYFKETDCTHFSETFSRTCDVQLCDLSALRSLRLDRDLSIKENDLIPLPPNPTGYTFEMPLSNPGYEEGVAALEDVPFRIYAADGLATMSSMVDDSFGINTATSSVSGWMPDSQTDIAEKSSQFLPLGHPLTDDKNAPLIDYDATDGGFNGSHGHSRNLSRERLSTSPYPSIHASPRTRGIKDLLPDTFYPCQTTPKHSAMSIPVHAMGWNAEGRFVVRSQAPAWHEPRRAAESAQGPSSEHGHDGRASPSSSVPESELDDDDSGDGLKEAFFQREAVQPQELGFAGIVHEPASASNAGGIPAKLKRTRQLMTPYQAQVLHGLFAEVSAHLYFACEDTDEIGSRLSLLLQSEKKRERLD